MKGKTIVAADTCKGCHGATMDYKKVMPGTAQTAGGLFVRTHSFNPNPRPSGATADTLPAPVYAFPK